VLAVGQAVLGELDERGHGQAGVPRRLGQPAGLDGLVAGLDRVAGEARQAGAQPEGAGVVDRLGVRIDPTGQVGEDGAGRFDVPGGGQLGDVAVDRVVRRGHLRGHGRAPRLVIASAWHAAPLSDPAPEASNVHQRAARSAALRPGTGRTVRSGPAEPPPP
jgi:hypothetical protein